MQEADGTRVHVTEKNARDSLEFLRRRPRDRPFVLSVGYFAAHAEDNAKEQYLPQDWSARQYARGVKNYARGVENYAQGVDNCTRIERRSR